MEKNSNYKFVEHSSLDHVHVIRFKLVNSLGRYSRLHEIMETEKSVFGLKLKFRIHFLRER